MKKGENERVSKRGRKLVTVGRKVETRLYLYIYNTQIIRPSQIIKSTQIISNKSPHKFFPIKVHTNYFQ